MTNNHAIKLPSADSSSSQTDTPKLTFRYPQLDLTLRLFRCKRTRSFFNVDCSTATTGSTCI